VKKWRWRPTPGRQLSAVSTFLPKLNSVLIQPTSTITLGTLAKCSDKPEGKDEGSTSHMAEANLDDGIDQRGNQRLDENLRAVSAA
jgi:hypothetical protein